MSRQSLAFPTDQERAHSSQSERQPASEEDKGTAGDSLQHPLRSYRSIRWNIPRPNHSGAFSGCSAVSSKELPIQMMTGANKAEQIRAPLSLDLVIKYIRERGTKHPLPTLVLIVKQKGLQHFRRRDCANRICRSAARMVAPAHLAAALCPFFGVTEIAGGRCTWPKQLRASDPGVKCRISSLLDFGAFTHVGPRI